MTKASFPCFIQAILEVIIEKTAGRGNKIHFTSSSERPNLGPLELTACEQIVSNIGGQMGLVYGEGAAERVAEISSGHPFLARQLCSTALRGRGEEDGNEVTLAQIEAAAIHFLNEPNTVSLVNERGIWGEVTDSTIWTPVQVEENEAMIVSLAEHEQPESELLSTTKNRSAREESLYELGQRAVVGRIEEFVRIQFGIFRDWIVRNWTRIWEN